jgi:DNA polymerase-3 subunit epsilon
VTSSLEQLPAANEALMLRASSPRRRADIPSPQLKARSVPRAAHVRTLDASGAIDVTCDDAMPSADREAAMAARRARGPSFTAIDFETANRYRNSACAVGVVQVRDGRVVERAYELIRPPFRLFEFTYIHNLSWDDVAGAATFERVWKKLAPLLRGSSFLAAHNAPFDRGVLRACCQWYGLETPSTPFECTVKLARAKWGIFPTKLPDVARHLGLTLKHHDAASDAEACAMIVIRSMSERSAP